MEMAEDMRPHRPAAQGPGVQPLPGKIGVGEPLDISSPTSHAFVHKNTKYHEADSWNQRQQIPPYTTRSSRQRQSARL